MGNAPKAVIDAVLAQQEKKRQELVQWQAELDNARRLQAAAQSGVDLAKEELEALRAFLMEAGAGGGDEETSAIDLRPELGEAIEYVVAGRSLRTAVSRCIDMVAKDKPYFSVDDVMAKIAQEHYVLGVENPRVRVSQILTLASAYSYNEARKAWTKKENRTRTELL